MTPMDRHAETVAYNRIKSRLNMKLIRYKILPLLAYELLYYHNEVLFDWLTWNQTLQNLSNRNDLLRIWIETKNWNSLPQKQL